MPIDQILEKTDRFLHWNDQISHVRDHDLARVHLPEGDALEAALRFVDIPEEDKASIVAERTALENQPELLAFVLRSAALIAANLGNVDGPRPFPNLRDINDPEHRFLYVLVFIAALDAVRHYHRELGIPDEISKATLEDLGRNVRVHRKREGIGGLGVAWWLLHHFQGNIYQLGRLQFEIERPGKALSESMSAHGRRVMPNEHALSVHIPDFLGPFTHDACTNSIERARQFFPRYFPDINITAFGCSSWLLDPQLKAILKPDSNIIRFQDRFTLTDSSYVCDDSIMQFVFGVTMQGIDSVPQVTSLQRGIVTHLQQGHHWQGRSGWFPFEENAQ